MGPTEAAFGATFERIAAGADLNAFVRVMTAEAMAAARAADRRQGRSQGPLDRVPVAIKDNLAVAGVPTTAGIPSFRDRIADADAEVVAALRAAGAIVVGKLNMDEGALGATCANPHYGRCLNPLMPDRTPGGSSGGSAAAVAAGLVPIALGTDTMGSVRIPAAYCGIFGLKPTSGLIGRAGLTMLAPSLDTIGPLARDLDLLWDALAVIATRPSIDPEALPIPANWHEAPRRRDDLAGIVLGVPAALGEVDCAPEIRRGFERARAIAADLGAITRAVTVAGWHPSQARRAGLLIAEAEGAALFGTALDGDPDALGATFRALLRYGRNAPSARLVQAYATMRAVSAGCARGMAEIDALIMPTAPQRAFPHGQPAPANQADLTALANLAGRPALTLPVPLAGEALPAAVQLVGAPWAEAALISMAGPLVAALQENSGSRFSMKAR